MQPCVSFRSPNGAWHRGGLGTYMHSMHTKCIGEPLKVSLSQRYTSICCRDTSEIEELLRLIFFSSWSFSLEPCRLIIERVRTGLRIYYSCTGYYNTYIYIYSSRLYTSTTHRVPLRVNPVELFIMLSIDYLLAQCIIIRVLLLLDSSELLLRFLEFGTTPPVG